MKNIITVKKIFFGIFLLQLSSCNNSTEISNKENDLFQEISIRNNLDVVEPDYKKLFGKSSLSELVLPDSIFVSNVNKLKFFEEKILILDKKFSKLLVFDNSGKFLGSVGALGFGPGEFQEITDFEVKFGVISVYSKADFKIFRFNLSNLSFIDSIKIDFFANSMIQLSENEFLFYVNHNPSDFSKNKNIIFLNTKSDESKMFFEYDQTKSNSVIDFSGFLEGKEGEIYFSLPFDNKVFVFDERELDFNLKYKFDNVSDEILENREDFQKLIFGGMLLDKSKKVSVLGSIFLKNERYVVFKYLYNSTEYYGVYKFNTKEFKVFSKKSLSDLSINVLGDPLYISESDDLCFAFTSEPVMYYQNIPEFSNSYLAPFLPKEIVENRIFLFKSKIEFLN